MRSRRKKVEKKASKKTAIGPANGRDESAIRNFKLETPNGFNELPLRLALF